MAPTKRPEKSTGLPVFWIAAGAVVVILVAAVIFSAAKKDSDGSSGGNDSGVTTGEFGSVTVTGAPLSPFAAGADPTIGETIPTVVGKNFAGDPVTIAPDGKAQMIVFLAHWCPHCNAEAPRLADYLRANGGTPAGTQLTLVPTGSDPNAPNWPPSEWIDQMKLGDERVLVDDEQQAAAKAFGLSSYPFIVMTDGDGKVVARVAGEQADGFFQTAFDALAQGKSPVGG